MWVISLVRWQMGYWAQAMVKSPLKVVGVLAVGVWVLFSGMFAQF